jgi:hypothetical protein
VSPGGLRYDEVRQKSAHNCFQRHEGVLDQFAYWRIRSFEVDIHRSKPYAPALHGDWYVFHERWDAFTSVEKLSGLLSLLHAIHFTVPEHEVVTVFLDLKESLSRDEAGPHSGRALDRLLREHLGAAILTPADLLGRACTLQDAVAGGWPLLRELRGRFVFVLTGKLEYLERYAGNDETARDRVAFVSRRIDDESDVPGPSHVLFYNMEARRVGLARAVHARGLVSRAYYVDSKKMWSAARAASCHHIATDRVNSAEDGWSRTSGDAGWPFEALAGEEAEASEPGDVCGVWSLTGDIWSDRDSFYFHYVERHAHDADHTYDFCVSSPNSGVADWAKACVMARASLRQDAPYFGVFRMGEKAGLRVQLRDRAGAPTVKHELVTPPGFEPDTLALLRLRVSRGGRQADGFASLDGEEWTHIARWDFADPLLYQGLGVSGHGSRRGVKFLFAVPRGADRPPFDRGRIVGPATGRRGWSEWDGERRWKVRAWDE